MPEPLKLLQLSDSHLFGESGRRLIGVDTEQTLQAVVGLMAEEQGVSALIATGDLSQDGSLASYQRFADALKPLDRPLYWLPGNHDRAEHFHAASDSFPLPQRAVVDLESWRIVLLDSVVPGAEHGYLEQSELDYLAHHVRDDGRHHLLAMHHHPVASGCVWLDTMRLQNARTLLEQVSRLPGIRGIIYGHIHQASSGLHHGISLLSAPSTCFQFQPNSREFTIDALAPGYRRLLLHDDGRIDSEVIRLPDFQLHVDPGAGGY